MMATQPKPDLLRFIAHTITGTVSATRSRIIIFCVILFLQFLAVPLMAGLLGYYYPDTYNGLKQKIGMEGDIGVLVGIIEYLLLVVLLIMSPAEHTSKRRLGKYIFLLWALWNWASADAFFSGIKLDDNKHELADKSFHENAVPIYGKVVFTSYMKYEKKDHSKRLFTVAEKLSPQTRGYIVIVQLNDSGYHYHGLDSLYHPFNYYTKDGEYQLNIRPKDPDISNCLKFIFDFPASPHRVLALPGLGKYVKIMYDPYENGIEMYTDSATAVTPSFDSIPSAKHE